MVSSAIDDAVKAYGIILSQGDISISRKGDIIISLLHGYLMSNALFLFFALLGEFFKVNVKPPLFIDEKRES